MNEEALRVLDRIAEALEKIAENTKPENIKEKDSRVTGFSAGEKK